MLAHGDPTEQHDLGTDPVARGHRERDRADRVASTLHDAAGETLLAERAGRVLDVWRVPQHQVRARADPEVGVAGRDRDVDREPVAVDRATLDRWLVVLELLGALREAVLVD